MTRLEALKNIPRPAEECVEKTLNGEVPVDLFIARGHPNVRASNKRTLEVTKDVYLTRRGDCIIACCAEKAAGELSATVLEALMRSGLVVLIIDAGVVWDYVIGITPRSKPASKWRLVARKSNYVDDSTIAILADKAAYDLDRTLIRELKRGVPVRIIVGVCPGDSI
ncbi:DUF371 domain-containing protein [Pyrobaculum aerophilum]|uniref:DUF371 domain-containing protein n=1 Tax=Pyrobaculum aerophilum (strain ATCC 51768 / DSM 7523 / JCM 9630 / CIP 104966 / NBRC 100827 / IM2) TaxID=178306 RepID=Q8ZYT8_PYRAE|nr:MULTISPECIES: DUF371 domain-containing protein [Pyrobaculum]AAL62905.1 conserved hypothetical protein [Pyrobaculum aerophilum str. IM2]MCX8135898.1 DUF371 domain-containing protein [Pyrobaculum aerophilum]